MQPTQHAADGLTGQLCQYLQYSRIIERTTVIWCHQHSGSVFPQNQSAKGNDSLSVVPFCVIQITGLDLIDD
jgi:hypothetical protein